ncbi:MAG: hypothetical protein LBB38_02530 [Puniceicoccales bacterium]|nr:hypothetical protein [Puniceicoccales bacterium]
MSSKKIVLHDIHYNPDMHERSGAIDMAAFTKEVRRRDAFDAKATGPALKWLRTATPADGDLFQYGEVYDMLKKHSVPPGHEATFCREILLRNLATDPGIKAANPSLVAILYTIDLVAMATGKVYLTWALPFSSNLLLQVKTISTSSAREVHDCWCVADYTQLNMAKLSRRPPFSKNYAHNQGCVGKFFYNPPSALDFLFY